MQPEFEPNLFLTFLPFLIVTTIFFVLSIPISRRKGKSFVFPLLVLIPFAAPFIIFYLASLTDKEVLDRLAALEGKVR